jgi:hypothetical protein
MQTKIISHFIFLFFGITLSAQTGQQNPCINEVSTDPDAPTNLNLPNETSPGYDQYFLNNFDWIPRNSSGNFMNLTTTDIPYLGSQQYMYTLYDPPTGFSQYYNYLKEEWIMTTNLQGGFFPDHQNGWELISVNLGFFPNGDAYTDEQNVTNQYTRIPYVILYHRYLSKIRVFANIGDEWAENNAYQAVRIRMTLNDDKSKYDLNGLFRLQEGMDQTLDQETEVVSIGALAEAPNDKQRWFSADFTVAYDPCVCNYSSAINLDFELIKNLDLKLYGRGITLEEEIVVDSNGVLVDNDFFSGFSVEDVNPKINTGGFVMYERMENLLDDYVKRMEHYDSILESLNKYNEEVERNLAVVKWVKHAINVGILAATGGSPLSVALTNDLLSKASGVVGSSITASQLTDHWEKVFKAAEKIIGKEISTFVSESFKKKDVPNVPNKPTANFTEMYFDGKITQVDPKNGPTIYTPGTYGNSVINDLPNQHYYPVYNEALGVFALLEKPKVDIRYTYDYNAFTHVNVPSITYTALNAGGDVVEIPFENATKVLREHITQISLKDDLKYSFNPALEIKDYSIEASLLFNIEVKNPNPRKHPEINSQGVMLNHDSIHSVIYPPVKTGMHDVNIESISFNAGENTTLDQGETYKVNTTYMPIDAFKSLTASVGMLDERIYLGSYQYALNQGWIIEQDRNLATFNDVYLKLLINVTFEGEKSDGSPHEYTYMFTYKVDDINTEYGNPLVQNLPGSIFDYTQYPENLILNAETFDGSQVDGCQLNGNTYLCKAWNNVEVSGEFAVANNYEVIVEAGNEINVLPESITPPEMIWQIAPVLDLSNPMPPVDAAYVQSFCQDENEYKARSGMITHTDTDSIPSDEEREEDHFAFNVFPNPTGERTTVSITLNEAAVGELFVTDVNGRRLGSAFINQRLSEGKTEHQLPTESLASGIYLVHLVVDGKRHVKRLVKK